MIFLRRRDASGARRWTDFAHSFLSEWFSSIQLSSISTFPKLTSRPSA